MLKIISIIATMNKLTKPSNIYRTTLDQALFENVLPYVGIYVMAYMGKILYVGKAEDGIKDRLTNHISMNKSLIGIWLKSMEADWHNVRLDVLEPLDCEDRRWLVQAEMALVQRFVPLFNEKLIP